MKKKTNVILIMITIISLFFLQEVNASSLTDTIGNSEAPSVNVTATSISTLKVEFNDIDGIDQYKIQYKKTSDTNWESTVITQVETDTFYTIENAEVNTEYEVQVIPFYTVDEQEVEGNSGYAKGSIDFKVINVQATLVEYGNIQISFDAVPYATKYKIYRSTSKTGTYSLISTTSKTTINNTKNVIINKNYYYKVVAINEDIVSPASDIVSAKSYLPQPTVTAKSSSYSSVRISYNTISGAQGYEIYRATSKTGKYTLVKTTTDTSSITGGLTTSKTYYYKVRAYRVVSGKKYYSAYSDVVSVIPKVSSPKVTVTSYDYNANKITITKPLGAQGYAIYRKDSKNGTFKLIKRTTSTTYIDPNLETGKTYYYKVQAYRVVDGVRKYGPYKSIVSSAPTLKTPTFTVDSSSSRSSLTIKINAVNGAEGYYIYEKVDGQYILIGQTQTTKYVDPNLELGSIHTYKVVAYRGDNVSNYSSSFSASVKPRKLNIKVTNNTFYQQNVSATLNEVEYGDEVTIYIYRSTSKNGTYSLIHEETFVSDGSTNYSYDTDEVKLKQVYYYKAKIRINGVLSNYSNTYGKTAVTTPEIAAVNYEYNSIMIGTEYDAKIDGYQIYRSKSGKSGTYTKVYDGSDPINILTGELKKGYYYKVRYYKVYDGKKVYSPFSSRTYVKFGMQALDDYPLSFESTYTDSVISSVSLTVKKTTDSYVYYNFKINYQSTYAMGERDIYFTVYFYDWQGYKIDEWRIEQTFPNGTKNNWSKTYEIKVPKGAVYFMFD